jgi:hypothetical protein
MNIDKIPSVREATLAELRTHAGFIAARKNAPNGGWNVLYRAEEQGISVEDGGKYAVVCHSHGSLLQMNNLRQARSALRFPDFCDHCEGRCLASWAEEPCPDCGRKENAKFFRDFRRIEIPPRALDLGMVDCSYHNDASALMIHRCEMEAFQNEGCVMHLWIGDAISRADVGHQYAVSLSFPNTESERELYNGNDLDAALDVLEKWLVDNDVICDGDLPDRSSHI